MITALTLSITAITAEWRIVITIVFVSVLVISLIYTLYNTYKGMIEHNRKEKEVHRIAQYNIRMRQFMDLVLEKNKAFLWEEDENHRHRYTEAFKKLMNLSDEDMDNIRNLIDANAFYSNKLKTFFRITKPGTYDTQIYAALHGHPYHWYAIKMQVEKTPKGIVRHGLSREIDHVKQREAMILETQRLLANAKESENFISSMNHEIRTPLNAIVGISQLLTTPGYELTDEEVSIYSEEMEKNNILLMKMIEDMLTVTLMDNSNARMSLENINIGYAMNENELLKTNGDLNINKIHIYVDGGPKNAVIKADKVLLARVMYNLLSNAAKFSPEGSTVRINWTMDSHNVTIFVRDEGKGIASQYHSLIFQRFFKVDSFIQGTGLGLPLSKMIVEKMGGNIGVNSKPNRGSTFWIRFNRLQQKS